MLTFILGCILIAIAWNLGGLFADVFCDIRKRVRMRYKKYKDTKHSQIES